MILRISSTVARGDENMRVLIIEPLKEPYVKDIDGSLETMQKIVGGTIQALYPFDNPIALVCNDDGKLLRLPLNRALFDEQGNIYDIIAGTFFICAAPSDSDSFASLTDEQIKKFSKRFDAMEFYLKL